MKGSNSKWDAVDKRTPQESNPATTKIPKQRPKPDSGSPAKK